MEAPKLMTLTDAAAERVKRLMAMADQPVLGVRVGVSQQGCSGMSYKMEYAEDERPGAPESAPGDVPNAGLESRQHGDALAAAQGGRTSF